MVSEHQICKCFVLNLTNISNFHSLEVVGRGSETQLPVSENLNDLILRFRGWSFYSLGLTSRARSDSIVIKYDSDLNNTPIFYQLTRVIFPSQQTTENADPN